MVEHNNTHVSAIFHKTYYTLLTIFTLLAIFHTPYCTFTFRTIFHKYPCRHLKPYFSTLSLLAIFHTTYCTLLTLFHRAYCTSLTIFHTAYFCTLLTHFHTAHYKLLTKFHRKYFTLLTLFHTAYCTLLTAQNRSEQIQQRSPRFLLRLTGSRPKLLCALNVEPCYICYTLWL